MTLRELIGVVQHELDHYFGLKQEKPITGNAADDDYPMAKRCDIEILLNWSDPRDVFETDDEDAVKDDVDPYAVLE